MDARKLGRHHACMGAATVKENLWIRLIADYWSDPRNIIGPPGALVRRAFKLLWMVLSVYVLFWVAGPSQVESWKLWMKDDRLATDIAWAFVFASALCFAIVGYAAEATSPVRVPIPWPQRIWPLDKWRWVHVHLPNIRVTTGSILAASLFLIALLGQWNYYLHDNLSTGGASVAALSGATSSVEEAEAALAEHDRSTAAALAIIDQGIRETSAGSPTGRSRLVAQRAALTTQAARVRAQLAADLRTARSANVEVRTTATDPRPVDGQVAAATGADRDLVSSLLDLLRSGVVEALLVMGAALGLVGGTSRLGVPKDEASFAPAPPDDVLETPPAPEAEPEPPPRRRFVLPEANEQDFSEAVVIGPHAPAAATDAPGEAEGSENDPAPDAPAAAEEAPVQPEPEIDPLIASELERESA